MVLVGVESIELAGGNLAGIGWGRPMPAAASLIQLFRLLLPNSLSLLRPFLIARY